MTSLITLEDVYKEYASRPVTQSDIGEHLPRLRELASKCESVTEFGMREGHSTVAFLAAQPKTLISWDIDAKAIASPRCQWLLSLAGKTVFQPRVGNTLEIAPIEPTDLLFIDTLHTARQLKAELERHVDPTRNAVRKYIAFHDTATFGYVSEDGTAPGLRAAIRWFQREFAFPIWELIDDRPNCNGLVVLRRIDVKDD